MFKAHGFLKLGNTPKWHTGINQRVHVSPTNMFVLIPLPPTSKKKVVCPEPKKEIALSSV